MEKKPSTKISKEDLEIWNKFIKENRSVEDKDLKLTSKNNRENNKIIDLRVDLHGYTIKEAFKKIDDLFSFSKEKNVKKILIITGKGLHSNKESDPYASKDLSLLRYAIPDYLNKNFSSLMLSIESSPLNLGGEGSIIVTLKKS